MEKYYIKDESYHRQFLFPSKNKKRPCITKVGNVLETRVTMVTQSITNLGYYLRKPFEWRVYIFIYIYLYIFSCVLSLLNYMHLKIFDIPNGLIFYLYPYFSLARCYPLSSLLSRCQFVMLILASLLILPSSRLSTT